MGEGRSAAALAVSWPGGCPVQEVVAVYTREASTHAGASLEVQNHAIQEALAEQGPRASRRAGASPTHTQRCEVCFLRL